MCNERRRFTFKRCHCSSDTEIPRGYFYDQDGNYAFGRKGFTSIPQAINQMTSVDGKTTIPEEDREDVLADIMNSGLPEKLVPNSVIVFAGFVVVSSPIY